MARFLHCWSERRWKGGSVAVAGVGRSTAEAARVVDGQNRQIQRGSGHMGRMREKERRGWQQRLLSGVGRAGHRQASAALAGPLLARSCWPAEMQKHLRPLNPPRILPQRRTRHSGRRRGRHPLMSSGEAGLAKRHLRRLLEGGEGEPWRARQLRGETLRELGIEPGTDHVPGMCVHRHARTLRLRPI
jgi:hypothetical protein